VTLATRIQLCGRLVAEIEGRRVEDELPGVQGRLLFAYLVANRRRPCGRSDLVDVLWPDGAPSDPETGLSVLLSKLRRIVAPATLEGRGSLQLRLPSGSWIDLEAAAEAIHRAESAIARKEWTEAWGPGRVAQHIAARDFLPGEGGAWIEEVRAALQALYVRALEVTAQAGLGIGGTELDTAERSARSLIACSPYRESGYRFLMEVLDRRGNTAEALTVYEELRRRLRDELGAAPGPVTQEVHRRLLGRS
jgi:DNA-binding SARP family transcriptional activator